MVIETDIRCKCGANLSVSHILPIHEAHIKVYLEPCKICIEIAENNAHDEALVIGANSINPEE